MQSNHDTPTSLFFGPKRVVWVVILTFSILAGALSLLAARFGAGNDAFFFSGLTILFGAFIIVSIVGLLRGVPSLALDTTGLTHRTMLGARRWRWSELGGFELDAQEPLRFGQSWSRHYACAFTLPRPAEDAWDETATPNVWNADIRIPLNRINCGPRRDDVWRLIAQLNLFRERYGSFTAD